MLNQKIFLTTLAVLFIAAGFMAKPADARNCGVARANIIDDNPAGPLGGQISQTSIRSGGGTNQAIIAARAIADQASPAGFDVHNLFLLKITTAPGGHSFWHYHPGVNTIMVKEGELTYYTVNRDGSCTEHTIGPTDGFVEVPGMVHAIENKSDDTEVVVYASVLMSEDLSHFTVDSDCSDNFCDPGLKEPTGANCPTGFGTSNSNGDACQ